jgi:hypothetical protein
MVFLQQRQKETTARQVRARARASGGSSRRTVEAVVFASAHGKNYWWLHVVISAAVDCALDWEVGLVLRRAR